MPPSHFPQPTLLLIHTRASAGRQPFSIPPIHRQSDAPIVFAKSIAVPLPHDASKHRLEPAEAIERHSHEGHTRNTLVTGKGIS